MAPSLLEGHGLRMFAYSARLSIVTSLAQPEEDEEKEFKTIPLDFCILVFETSASILLFAHTLYS